MQRLTALIPICVLLIQQVSSMSDEEQAIYTNHHKECVSSSGVDATVLENAFEGRVLEDLKLKKYINCFFTRLGFQNEAGEMCYQTINEFIPHITRIPAGDKEKIIIDCNQMKLKGATPEDTAFLHFKCYLGALED